MMPAFLRPAPWPPALEPGETILLEGAASGRKYARIMGLTVTGLIIVVPFMDYGLGWIIHWVTGRPAPDSFFVMPTGLLGDMIAFAIFLVVIDHLLFRRNRHWMLTSDRFVQQGAGKIPRSEIGKVTTWSGAVVVHRAGPDQLLNGPKFHLAFLEDRRGVRDALERLK